MVKLSASQQPAWNQLWGVPMVLGLCRHAVSFLSVPERYARSRCRTHSGGWMGPPANATDPGSGSGNAQSTLDRRHIGRTCYGLPTVAEGRGQPALCVRRPA
jgi:hypothetical protein